MKSYIKIAFASALLATSSMAVAQTLHSTYFLEGNNQRNLLNPAFASDDNFITFPLLGNLNISANSNIGLGAIMQPRGSEMVTFMHSSISADDALSKFKKNNIIETDINLNIMTVGFNKWNGTNTIGLSLRSQTGAYIPKDIFSFLKEGQTESSQEYNIGSIDAVTQNYLELALGHSHKINDKISVGAKVKLLVGAAYSKAHAEDVRIYMSDNKWTINERSSLIGSKGMEFETDETGELTGFNFDNFGVAGYGLGLDLGVVYRINEAATVSFAVTDIGFMSWNNCVKATNKNQEFTFEGFDNMGVEDNPDGSNDFDDAADEVWDNLKGLVKYHDDGKVSTSSSLYTTFRAAGEYGILSNKISFGLLASMRVGAPKIWTEAMLTANFRPSKWFNAALNGSVSNVRGSLGAVLNFHTSAANFFIGTDYILAKYGKQFIPVDAAKFNFGMGLSFNI